ncbi:hypothetical protein K491DRAFT_747023 [Lophiostoma macrostomum CBS 122681]|uniref:Uncharacterized protein n=1 Tax=Lophiostoma macrostomum CBS 122681 TaxID=1314788 RepID=A0A6A6T6N4_9PLEO|nr:hypothetical protein K491DRAFT_747023 [Lophiostoma macrostomum CBS 122681]
MDYSPLSENQSTDKIPEVESDTCSTQCERCLQASGQMSLVRSGRVLPFHAEPWNGNINVSPKGSSVWGVPDGLDKLGSSHPRQERPKCPFETQHLSFRGTDCALLHAITHMRSRLNFKVQDSRRQHRPLASRQSSIAILSSPYPFNDHSTDTTRQMSEPMAQNLSGQAPDEPTSTPSSAEQSRCDSPLQQQKAVDSKVKHDTATVAEDHAGGGIAPRVTSDGYPAIDSEPSIPFPNYKQRVRISRSRVVGNIDEQTTPSASHLTTPFTNPRIKYPRFILMADGTVKTIHEQGSLSLSGGGIPTLAYPRMFLTASGVLETFYQDNPTSASSSNNRPRTTSANRSRSSSV